MKREKISEAMGDISSRHIKEAAEFKLEESARQIKRLWIKVALLVACLLLLISALIVVAIFQKNGTDFDLGSDATDNSVVTPQKHTPIIFDAIASPEKLNGSSLEFVLGSSMSVSGGGFAEAAPPAFQFIRGIAVKAKVVKNHPDTYYKLDVSLERKPISYRLIQMETLEVIRGKNVPQYFLYLIPESVYVDMSVYDSLLISMSQLGAENYVLKNENQQQIEFFKLPIFADWQDEPELGNIIAFTDGIFDEGLWQNDSWIYGYQFGRFYLDNPEHGNLVVLRGDSEDTVISAIQEQFEKDYSDAHEPSVITLDFNTKKAKDAIEYVKPFTNGVFAQTCYQYNGSSVLIFTRYINGCQTEETVKIDILTEEVTYSDIRYSKEDLERVENISVYLSQKVSEYEDQLPSPPHITTDEKELLALNLCAWYVKTEDKIYGVLKTAWRYQDKNEDYVQHYDDSYILYDMREGTATDISRDDLVAIVGTRNVYMGKYGVGIEMPI